MSLKRLTIIVAAVTLLPAAASAQVGIRLGVGGIGLGFSPPVLRERQQPESVERHRAPQRSVRHKQNSDDDDVKTAKKAPEPEQPKTPEAQNENSTVSIAVPEKGGATATAPIEKAEASVDNENSTITGASATTVQPEPVKAPVTTADTASEGKPEATCKRYFPTVGQTVSVPCD
jgi:hypothetical protein